MAGKSDETEVCRRVEEVLHLILDGADHHAIVQHAAAKGWDVEERQLRTYASRAHDLLVDRQERSRKRTIARHVAQRERIFKKCVDAEDFKTALSVLTDLAKLRGLYPGEGSEGTGEARGHPGHEDRGTRTQVTRCYSSNFAAGSGIRLAGWLPWKQRSQRRRIGWRRGGTTRPG
ncbi:MAG: hypothetical protein U0792_00620 [Gemmataceae bacterium]